jgi:hypothetical protein
MKSFFNKLSGKPGFASFLASLASIGVGLIAGFILLIFFDAGNSVYGLSQILFTGITSAEKAAKVSIPWVHFLRCTAV